MVIVIVVREGEGVTKAQCQYFPARGSFFTFFENSKEYKIVITLWTFTVRLLSTVPKIVSAIYHFNNV